MRLFLYPPTPITVSVPPLEFSYNGVDTPVNRDTATPGNSRPLPVIALDSSGDVISPLTSTQLPAVLGSQPSADSLSVAIASDQIISMATVDAIVSGNITTQNLNPLTGVATTGSSVEIDVDGGKTVALIQVTGTYTGALNFQGTVDGSTWITVLSGTNRSNGANVQNINGVAGIYAFKVSGFTKFRLSAATGAITGTAVVTINLSASDGYVAIDQPLPTGTNFLGSIFSYQPGNIGGEYDIRDIDGTISLPTGASTEATLEAARVLLASIDGKDFATQTTLAALLTELQLKADLSEIQPVSIAGLTPTYQEITDLTTSAQTFTAPAGAKWAKVMADDTNTVNIRVKIGGTATISSGLQFQAGRSEDFSAVGDISVIAESGTDQKIYVQFGA